MDVMKGTRSYYIKHKDSANFDSAKFTPDVIYNKIKFDDNLLISYFNDNHPLSDCAKYFNCSIVTIKRKLRSLGVDTSKYNHSAIAKSRSSAIVCKNIPINDIIKLYQTDNLDTKTIAEKYGLFYGTVRMLLRKHGIRKVPKDVSRSMRMRHYLKTGYSHPAQRPDVLMKTKRSQLSCHYTSRNGDVVSFRSLHELGYAILLDVNNIEWHYEEMRIPYIDMLTGKSRIYVIDFTVCYDDRVEWIEVKPNNKMMPADKVIYATRRAEESNITFRGLFDDERTQIWWQLRHGDLMKNVVFTHRMPKSTQSTITYHFNNKLDADNYALSGWKPMSKIIHGDNLISLKMKKCK